MTERTADREVTEGAILQEFSRRVWHALISGYDAENHDHPIPGVTVRVHPAYYEDLCVAAGPNLLAFGSRYGITMENNPGPGQPWLRIFRYPIHSDPEVAEGGIIVRREVTA